MSYTLRKFTGLNGLQSLETVWGDLTKRMRLKHFTHSYYYYLAALRVLDAVASDIDFFVLFSNERAVFIAPLERHSRTVSGVELKILRTPTAIYLPFWDPIVDASIESSVLVNEFLHLLSKEFSSQWHCLELDGLLDDSTLLTLNTGNNRAKIVILPSHEYHDLPCRPAEELRSALSKKVRANLRQAMNRLRKAYDFEFLAYRNCETLPMAMDSFLELEASGWKSRAGSSVRQNLQVHAFYKSLIEMYPQDPEGSCEISELRVHGKPIASLFCLTMRDIMYTVKIGYDEAFAKVSPGILLFNWTIERYCDRGGFTHINFLSDTPWAKSWEPAVMFTRKCEIYADSMSGTVVWRARKLKRAFIKD